MKFAFLYVAHFAEHLVFAWPLLGFQGMVIVALGLIVGRLESWKRFDAIYWAFITATTVGYGDVRPEKTLPRVLSILIAFVGLTFTGLIVALAINAASLTLKEMMELADTASRLPAPQ
jgi:voltage-gated potassium channel